jgi:hypothetical protein
MLAPAAHAFVPLVSQSQPVDEWLIDQGSWLDCMHHLLTGLVRYLTGI